MPVAGLVALVGVDVAAVADRLPVLVGRGWTPVSAGGVGEALALEGRLVVVVWVDGDERCGLLSEVRWRRADAGVMALMAERAPELVRHAFLAGADVVVDVSQSAVRLCDGVDQAAASGASRSRQRHSETADVGLDETELALVRLLADGVTVAEMPHLVYMSPRSLRRRLHDLRGKLGAETNAVAVQEARLRRLLG